MLLTNKSLEDVLIGDREKWEKKLEIKNKKLLISNYKSNPESLTPVGYDLTIGGEYAILKHNIKAFEDLPENKSFHVKPGDIVAIETEEFIGMPQSRIFSGIIVSKVSVSEKGFSHISSSIDADYKGTLIVTMTNLSNRTLLLKRGQPFCTMIILENTDESFGECRKHPDTHKARLIKEWKKDEESLLNFMQRTFIIAFLYVPSICLLYILVFFPLTVQLMVPIFVAFSATLAHVISLNKNLSK